MNSTPAAPYPGASILLEMAGEGCLLGIWWQSLGYCDGLGWWDLELEEALWVAR